MEGKGQSCGDSSFSVDESPPSLTILLLTSKEPQKMHGESTGKGVGRQTLSPGLTFVSCVANNLSEPQVTHL